MSAMEWGSLGAVLVSLVSLWIALRSLPSQNAKRLAETRQAAVSTQGQIIQDLRGHVDDLQEEMDKLHIELQALGTENARLRTRIQELERILVSNGISVRAGSSQARKRSLL